MTFCSSNPCAPGMVCKISRLVGGTDIQEGRLTWQVKIYEMNHNKKCGGSIINRLFVLSAAHCDGGNWRPCNDLNDESRVKKCKLNPEFTLNEKEKQYFNNVGKYAYPSNILGIMKISSIFVNLQLTDTEAALSHYIIMNSTNEQLRHSMSFFANWYEIPKRFLH